MGKGWLDGRCVEGDGGDEKGIWVWWWWLWSKGEREVEDEVVVSDGSVWLRSVMAGCWEVARWLKVAWRSCSRGSMVKVWWLERGSGEDWTWLFSGASLHGFGGRHGKGWRSAGWLSTEKWRGHWLWGFVRVMTGGWCEEEEGTHGVTWGQRGGVVK